MAAHTFAILIDIVLLIICSGFFSAAEIGLLSMPRFRAQQWARIPTPVGRALSWLLERPAPTLGTILIITTTANYFAEEIAATWVIHTLGPQYVWVAIVALSVPVIFLAEVTPILYAAANPERVAHAVAVPVRLAAFVLAIPAAIVSSIGNLLGGGQWYRGRGMTVAELRTIIRMEGEDAPLEEEEKEMLHSIFEFADTLVKDVMVARSDIAAVPETASIQEAALVAGSRRISRLPVFRGDLDHMLGLVFVKDLLMPLEQGHGGDPVTGIIRPAFSISADRQLSEVLNEFRRRKQMIAIVVDAAGKTVGLITIEDILEEIVGDIFDEYDLATPAVEWVRGEWIVDGRMSITELNELLAAELPEGRYTTVAGLLLSRLGSVPRESEKIEVDGFTFTVVRMDDHRVARVRITRVPVSESEDDTGT